MKLDDDSLLTAYLDGELSTAERLRVETALLESAELAERLTDLAAVRSLVQGLPRPTADRDFSPAILSEISHRRHAKLIRSRVASLVIAALLMLACVPLFLDWPRNERRTGGGRPGGLAANSKPAALNHVAIEAAALPATVASAEKHEGTMTTAGSADLDARGDLARLRDQERLRGLLEQPDVRRVVLVIDSLSAEMVAQVRGAVIETGRQEPTWGELRVNQGIVLDASHPEEAHVFALLMDDREFDHFKQEVESRLPGVDSWSSAAAAPGLVTQLADLDPVQVGEGRLISPLAPMPAELPTRSTFAAKAASGGGEGPQQASSEEEETAADDGAAGSLAVPAPGEHKDTRPQVYLVWVTTPRKQY